MPRSPRRRHPWVRRALVLAASSGLGCAHSEASAPDPTALNGPPSSTLPRQLTFNPGGERSPSVTGDAVLYSRLDPARGTRAQCLAILPVEGGTLRATLCPPDPSPADTFVGTWLEPALSPSRGELAFVWERGAVVSALGAWSHHLTIAPRDSAGAGRQIMIAGWASGERFYNTALELIWVDDETVRFLAAYQWIIKVKGGGASRLTDTLPVPRALMDLSVADGTMHVVPGGDSVIAYAPAADGGLWVVKESDPVTLLHLDPGGGLTARGAFPEAVTDLAEVDGRVAAATGGAILVWLDPVTADTGSLIMPGPVHRLAPAGDRLVIAEVESDTREFGAPAHLWLFQLPPRALY